MSRAGILRRAGRPLRRRDRRMLCTFAGTALVALAGIVLTLAVGEYTVPLGQLLAAMAGRADAADQLVVTTLRLPRVLVALFTGSALGMSGALLQGVTRNPLVAPDIIGVNNGAALAVVIAVVAGGGPPPTVVALGGALAVALVAVLLSLRSRLSRLRVVLVGIGINAALGAIITYLLTQANLDQVSELNQYLLGDVSAATWSTVTDLLPGAVVLMSLGLALGARLEVLRLGDEVAAGLGARVGRSRLLLFAVAACLAALAVAAAGPVGFVAFVAPHLARALAGTSGPGTLATSAAVGGTLIVLADYLAQRVLEPTQLPVGVITVLIGGPWFMVVLLRPTREAGPRSAD